MIFESIHVKTLAGCSFSGEVNILGGFQCGTKLMLDTNTQEKVVCNVCLPKSKAALRLRRSDDLWISPQTGNNLHVFGSSVCEWN